MSNATNASGAEATIPITTVFNKRDIIGLSQFAYDNGMTFPQDALRMIAARFLKENDYPKEVHTIKDYKPHKRKRK